MFDEHENRNVIIIGGGLVGALNACFFAQAGWKVDVFELRTDPRKEEFVPGRSINLAASNRSRAALAAVGLEHTMINEGVPMFARMVHPRDVHKGSKCYPVPYGKPNQHIVSINRRKLNETMLSTAESQGQNVSILFEHKLIRCDAEAGCVIIERLSDKVQITKSADLILGCDGAFSAVRQSLVKTSRFDFSQSYIEHGYIELNILPEPTTGEFQLSPDFFHLWPRGQFCLIALGNTDRTFTVTLFAPFVLFDTLISDDTVEVFFKFEFPDAYELIGREALLETFRNVKPSPLVTIRCAPHHKGKVLLMGDAAHAMVPFYGQGMNCGFEDCHLLSELLCTSGNNIEESLIAYSRLRVSDANAICDLALYNYEELRFRVAQSSFQVRKKVDYVLNLIFPNSWIPLYSMVTFSRIRYHEIILRRINQDRIIGSLTAVAYLTFTGCVLLTVHKVMPHLKPVFSSFLTLKLW